MNHILEEARKANRPHRTPKHELTVSAENIGELMNNLTNLYKNPAEACFRETLSNAVDSHYNVAKNTSETIKISTPNYNRGNSFFLEDDLYEDVAIPPALKLADNSAYNSNLIISDLGTGMSRVQIEGNFLSYGNGTKKGDKAQIGGFGYGGKSPLAVNNIFHVQSVQDGVLNSFTVSLDPDDSSIPPSFEWDEGMEEAGIPTDLPNGVTVTVNYGEVDHSWTPSIRNLVGLPKNAINIDGYDWDITLDNETYFKPVIFSGEVIGYVSTSDSLSYALSESKVYAVVGNIVYPITDNRLNDAEIFKTINDVKRVVVLKAPKNSVKFTPSRDEFIYNELTRETFKTLAEEVIDVMATDAQNEINMIDSLSEVIEYFAEAKKIKLPKADNLVYRNEGHVSNLFSGIDFKGFNYGKLRTYRYGSYKPSAEIFVFEKGNTSLNGFLNISENSHALIIEESYLTEEKFKSIRRYIARITSKIPAFSDKNNNFLIIPANLVDSNKWVLASLKSVYRYDEVLAATKKAISEERKVAREALKAGNIPVVSKNKTALFVTATQDEAKNTIVLKAHFKGKPSDLSTGENFYYSSSLTAAINDFALSGFKDSDTITYDATKAYYSNSKLAVEIAESKNATLVVLSSRQDYETVVNKLGAGAGKIDELAEKFASERVSISPVPSFSEFIAFWMTFASKLPAEMGHYEFSRMYNQVKNTVTSLSKYYAENGETFTACEVSKAILNSENVSNQGAFFEWKEESLKSIYNRFIKFTNLFGEGTVEAIEEYVTALQEFYSRYSMVAQLVGLGLEDNFDFAEVKNVVDFARNK